MLRRIFSSLIGRKIGMAVTGLLLYGFLIAHLAANTLLFRSDAGEAFNAYSEYMNRNPLLIPVELILLGIFILHIALAISVSRTNRRARPVAYQMKNRSVGGRSWASSTMIYSGLL